MNYSWEINEIDYNFIYDDYKQLKHLSYQEKLYVFKYLNKTWWNNVKYWDKADQDLFYQVNIYVNRSIENKLDFAYNFDDSIDKITAIYKELTYEDSSKLNLFKYIHTSKFYDLPLETQKLFIEHIYYKYDNNYSLFLQNFVYLFKEKLTKANATKYYNSCKCCDNLIELMNIINFVKSIYPECIYNERFNNNVNALLYVHFTNYPYSYYSYCDTYNLTDDEKQYISKVFTSKTKIQCIENVLFITLWLKGCLTVQEEKSLLNKFHFKRNERHYHKDYLIKILDGIVITNEENKNLINNIKFELALK